MNRKKKSGELSALDSMFAAQKIAFGPMVFHAVASMIDLGFFDAINRTGDHGITVDELVADTDVSEYGVLVLLETALGADIVTMTDDKRYVLTTTGYYLFKDELTRVNFNFVKDVCYRGMESLTDSIKNKRPAGLKFLGDWGTIYEGLSVLPEPAKKSWFEFDHYYSDIAFGDILPLLFDRPVKTVMDIGGNTGKFALKCSVYDKNVTVKIVDLPVQIAAARKNLLDKNSDYRVEFYEADMLDKKTILPDNIDVIWMSQFLDCFSPDEIVAILTKAQKALNDAGRIYILETFWDNQRFKASSYCLQNTSLYFTAIANGNSKMYSLEQMKKFVRDAGLNINKTLENIGLSHTLLECIK